MSKKEAPKDEIERMIGRRVEHMKGLYIIGAIMAWAATAFGVWVGFTYYSWAYPFSSGMYALSVLTVIIVFAFIFIWKVAMEKPAIP
jgi:hypothetical protein|uniref:Uncharacterized protein n=1 Tax=Candidatus Nitrosocaldus yellowstonensis TaxID=498375 RepID=B0LKZ5_9ARCH|nr:conserved hypothetical protein [Candidatus Nitrosocaldus yellowstonensis]